MNTQIQRAYRKNINAHGWMYLDGKVQEMNAKNISITGVLVQLGNQNNDKRIFKNLSITKSIDFYFPILRLSGEAKIVRVETGQDGQVMLALKFAKAAYMADEPVFKRQSFRKDVALPGRVLLNGKLFEFVSENISLGGLLIRLPETVPVEKRAIVHFELEPLKMKGFAKIVWSNPSKDKTLVGLQFVKPHKEENVA
jgi:hypothetical protein